MSQNGTTSLSLLSITQAANIPLVCELGIDKLSFDDFSLDVDAMITAALRMFMELGMVQKFKIDYEVRAALTQCSDRARYSIKYAVWYLHSSFFHMVKYNY